LLTRKAFSTVSRTDLVRRHHPIETPTASSPAVEFRHISASYQEGDAILPVLDDLSFTVMEGEFIALIGPSGAGKSTVLDLIAGLTEPDRGEILLDGHVLSTAERLGRTGYMHQNDLLMPWRTTLDNAALALEATGVNRRAARAAAQARMAEFGLAGFERAYPAQLSGGMRQRVAFLRTILTDRLLLLLDEPFGALDAFTRAAMQDFLSRLLARERRTVILVTHDVEEAVLLADRVIALSPRPGHAIYVEPVPLPRPRPRELITDPEFVAHKAAVLQALGMINAPISEGRR
jgi:ABC-type nitrate/sulfonate/bicarbonate transport system ATPase subunit